jgi:hypothetical protein
MRCGAAFGSNAGRLTGDNLVLLSDLRGEDVPTKFYSVAVQRERSRQSEPAGYSDTRLVADCHALATTRAILLAALASAANTDASERSRVRERLERLGNDLAVHTKRVSARPAMTARGLQCKRAVTGLLLAQLGDDPSPLCDALLSSLLADFEAVQVLNIPSIPTDLGDRADQTLIEACEACLNQIEEVCAECRRLGAQPPSDEQEDLTETLLSLLMGTRELVADVASMSAESIAGIRMKGRLLRRLMNVGDADAHYQRLMLARSFVADVASLGPHVELEDGTGHGRARWLSSLANRIWRRAA